MNHKACMIGVILVGLLFLGRDGFGYFPAMGQAQTKTSSHLTSAALPLRYRFSGAADDGQQGGASRAKATAVHCTNLSATNNQVEVQVYQYDGVSVFTGTASIPPNRTYTFTTQATTVYFDDVTLGGFPGTAAIYQGSGRILAQSGELICTAQVLDPLNLPPTFVTQLTLYYADGVMVGDDRYLYLPFIYRP